ncbi:MAG: transcription factor S [Thermoplasmatota archaeon]
MAFCPTCRNLVYPKDGQMTCRKCGWVGAAAAPRMVSASTPDMAPSRRRVVLEEQAEARPEQTVTCPKCGHDKAFFHLMQTRRSDEPPTQINECVKCHHSWRDYG